MEEPVADTVPDNAAVAGTIAEPAAKRPLLFPPSPTVPEPFMVVTDNNADYDCSQSVEDSQLQSDDGLDERLLDKAAYHMFQDLGKGYLLKLADALRFVPMMCITYGTVFSGSVIFSETVSSLTFTYYLMFRTKIEMPQVLMCEKDEIT